MEIKELIKQANERKMSRSCTIEVRADEADPDQHTFDLSFSSEEPYERWFGNEVLGHKSGEVDMSFLKSGTAPLLVDHNTKDLVGVVEKGKIASSRGTAVVRFGKSVRAQEIRTDVIDKVRTNVSVGYEVRKMELVEQREDGPNTYRVTEWAPFEISLVSIPADKSVGVGREFENVKKEPEKMSEPITVKPDPEAERLKKEQAARELKALEDSAVQSARDTEMKRIADIEEYGAQHGMKEQARQFIQSGKTADDFRVHILDEVRKKAETNANSISEDLSPKEKRDLDSWSLLKAVRELKDGKQLTGIEAEMHVEGEKEFRAASRTTTGNMFIPNMVMHHGKRDFTVGTEGADVVQTTLQPLIERLRNKLILQEMGGVFLTGLTGDLQFPRQTNQGTFAWEGENDNTAESTLTTDNVSLSPNRGGLYFDISNQALIQSSPDVENMHRNDLMAVVARAFDVAGISGDGTGNAPTGITNTAGIGSVVAGNPDGADLTWGDIVDLESAVAIDNADMGNLGYLTNTSVRGKLKQTERAAGTNGQFIWSGGELNGYTNVGVSNQVPADGTKGAGTDLSTIIFGNFNDLIMAMWGGMDILVDPYTQAIPGLLRLHLQIFADVAVRHPESFAACTDATTA